MVTLNQNFTNLSCSLVFDVNNTPPNGEAMPAWEEPCISPPCTCKRNSDKLSLILTSSMTRTNVVLVNASNNFFLRGKGTVPLILYYGDSLRGNELIR